MDVEALNQLRQVFIALDYLGVLVFALTGALVAARSRQDWVTCIFFAGMTGMGGGTIRDLLIGAPVFWLHDNIFMAIALGAAAAVWVLRTDRWPGKPLVWMDAVGVSSYCAFGSLKALSYGITPMPALLMGVITATFGGVLRDIVAGRPSILMQRDIYVTAAILGATVTVVGAVFFDLNAWVAGIIGGSVAFIMRGGAIIWGWRLPIHPG